MACNQASCCKWISGAEGARGDTDSWIVAMGSERACEKASNEEASQHTAASQILSEASKGDSDSICTTERCGTTLDRRYRESALKPAFSTSALSIRSPAKQRIAAQCPQQRRVPTLAVCVNMLEIDFDFGLCRLNLLSHHKFATPQLWRVPMEDTTPHAYCVSNGVVNTNAVSC